jgi:peroxiredoxin
MKIKLFVVLSLFCFFLGNFNETNAQAPMTGGYMTASVSDADVAAAAAFAVKKAKAKKGVRYSLLAVERAEKQVVAGTNYKMCLNVKEGDKTENFTAVVFQNLKQKLSLTSWDMSCAANDDAPAKDESALKNFTLTDTSGKEQSFDNLKGKNGAVVVFLSAQCPVVKGYNDRINKIAAEYQAKGINFVGINSNATESLEWVKSHADENYKFPVLIDKGNVLADQLGASVTPEVFYFDAKNALVYRGAIDDNRRGDSITVNFLRDAFDATLDGKTVSKRSAAAFGCTIKRVEKN